MIDNDLFLGMRLFYLSSTTGTQSVMKKLFLVTLLTFTLTPTASTAACKYVIDCYQQAISDLEAARARIKETRAEVNALIERANEIEQLIAKYEAALDKTTQALLKQLETRLKQIEADYA